jgi:hypothetical protein
LRAGASQVSTRRPESMATDDLRKLDHGFDSRTEATSSRTVPGIDDSILNAVDVSRTQ